MFGMYLYNNNKLRTLTLKYQDIRMYYTTGIDNCDL